MLTLFGWFGKVIHESRTGCYAQRNDISFRWAMALFIFSEVLFFSAFFAALFFIRHYSVPELGGEMRPVTHVTLWPNFTADWPLLRNPDNSQFLGPVTAASPWGIPTINTLLLLSSGITLTWAHWSLKNDHRRGLITGLAISILLGMVFLGLQANEYREAYEVHGLTLDSGAYGSLFFLLTGFHGAHVTIGATILVVILCRAIAGHFSVHNYFAFEGAAWYWHFVDVVWLMLFVFVYWL